jgi:hypothetical protein
MYRFLAFVGAAALTLSAAGLAAAQSSEPVNADGSFVVASDNGAPIASGRGDDIIYGDVNTGGAQGEVLGDPNAVYSPSTPDHPSPGQPVSMPGAGDGLIGGVPIQPQPAPADNTTATSTNLANDSGTTTENVPVESLAPDESAAPADDSGSAPVGFCSQYTTWYDAQVAYEGLGATAADPALVQEVDPDYDGIACEGEMA